MIKVRFLSVVVLATFCLAGTAGAATLPSGVSYNVGGTVVAGNVDLQSLKANTGNTNANYHVSGLSLKLDNAEIVKGNHTDWHLAPSGTGNGHYLAVYGENDRHHHSGNAVFELGKNITSFAFNWGSIDKYNYVTVTNRNNETYAISGSDIIASTVGIIAGTTSKYFKLIDLAGIKRVVLCSENNAFEISNISAVPVPAALVLFGSALAGMAALRRGKQKA